MTSSCYINGIQTEQISVYDRGLLYGQNLFETILVSNKQLFLLEQHLKRLKRGCDALSIEFNEALLRSEIAKVLESEEQKNKYVFRVCITMGVGGRGYLNPEQPDSQRILTTHCYPDHPQSNWDKGIVLGVSDVILSSQPLLAGLKHANRLEQTLARSQWQDNWQEALLCDANENVIEGTQSNVFIMHNQQLKTPDLSTSGVAGVMREQVLQAANELAIETKVMSLSLADFEQADEIMLSGSLIGLWPVKSFKNNKLNNFVNVNKLQQKLVKNGAIPNN